MNKFIGIGIENYKTLIENNYYYIDKTMMLKELADKKGIVNLFTRPRRFGKTLTLSMICTYFEDERTRDGEKKDNSRYFIGKRIMEAGERYTSEMGQYPVIKVSLKSAKQPSYEMAYNCLKNEVIDEFERHSYVLEGNVLSEKNKKRYQNVIDETAEESDYATALKFLSQCLYSYHQKKAIILIDEYDVPLENAYFRGFYDKMIDFVRSLFESALKTNDALEFAVVTGCLRISRESIFTGLNNLSINSILSNNYAEYFGFTKAEVEEMLSYYDLTCKLDEVKQWYDGYIFGETEVYNPWSIINYVNTAISESNPFPKPYWSNTSSNSIVRDLVEKADEKVKSEIERLIDGESIEKPVHEDITYEDIYRTQDNLWNFLFFTGYLKVTGKRFEDDIVYLRMSIPNREVKYVYKTTVREWFDLQLQTIDSKALSEAIIKSDTEKMEDIINNLLGTSMSYYDSKEAFYHGAMMILLKLVSGYSVESNKEAGDGRPDIILFPNGPRKPVIIMEFKQCEEYPEMEAGCMEALKQIEERKYAEPFEKKGYEVMKYGMCFCKKNCMIKRIDML